MALYTSFYSQNEQLVTGPEKRYLVLCEKKNMFENPIFYNCKIV